MKEKIANLTIIFLVLFIPEVVFEIFAFNAFENVFLKILFTLQIAIVLNIICVFKEKINKIILMVFYILTTILYVSQYTYYTVFENSIGLYDILKSSKMFEFALPVANVLINNILPILLMLIPLVIFCVLTKKIDIKRVNKKQAAIYIIAFVILYITSTAVICLDNERNIYSTKNLYYNINDGTENLKHFGVLTAARLDIQRTLLPFKEKMLYAYEDSDGIVNVIDQKDYNMLNIDFDTLIASETNSEINEIHKYIKLQEPTNKNEYTGKYKGKNLIVIVGESFSLQAIHKDITPTLYKLYSESIQFNNFYTPLFPVSTADGQYLSDTSLLPAEGLWSIEEVANKMFPYAYGNIFKAKGYETFAYHNGTYNYYNRQIYFNTFGYDTYLGNGNGLEERMDFSLRPASDFDMIKATVKDYINKDKFLAYYITMSGHMNYDNTNAMVIKNWNAVKDLPYSKKAKSYLATQIELDKAVLELIKELEKNNKLKDTIIVIMGDHYPYGLSQNEIIELTTFEIKDYDIDRFKMPLIIYNGENQSGIKVDKRVSSIDVLPTILNLYGMEYDSRLLMGKDIFSKAESLVIFSNRSFLTNNEIYNSNFELLYRDGKQVVDEQFIKAMKQNIYLKYRYSRLILENDYYRSVLNKQ